MLFSSGSDWDAVEAIWNEMAESSRVGNVTVQTLRNKNAQHLKEHCRVLEQFSKKELLAAELKVARKPHVCKTCGYERKGNHLGRVPPPEGCLRLKRPRIE